MLGPTGQRRPPVRGRPFGGVGWDGGAGARMAIGAAAAVGVLVLFVVGLGSGVALVSGPDDRRTRERAGQGRPAPDVRSDGAASAARPRSSMGGCGTVSGPSDEPRTTAPARPQRRATRMDGLAKGDLVAARSELIRSRTASRRRPAPTGPRPPRSSWTSLPSRRQGSARSFVRARPATERSSPMSLRTATAIGGGLVLTMVVVAVAGIAGIAALLGAGSTLVSADVVPSSTALADIPPAYLDAFQAAAATCPGLPWSVLAGIGRVETDFGQDDQTSSAGAVGPMQFLPATFAVYDTPAPPGGANPPAPTTRPTPSTRRRGCCVPTGPGMAPTYPAPSTTTTTWRPTSPRSSPTPPAMPPRHR